MLMVGVIIFVGLFYLLFIFVVSFFIECQIEQVYLLGILYFLWFKYGNGIVNKVIFFGVGVFYQKVEVVILLRYSYIVIQGFY